MQEKPRSAGRDANDSSPLATAEGGSGCGGLPESSAAVRAWIVCGKGGVPSRSEREWLWPRVNAFCCGVALAVVYSKVG
ncbi:hypothetical protein CEXT_138361 [Caerostris extrusa]|uniref:Uncharacterized protein n=1 Tax=Caerostris extrusa TaxID=172846 RepID=A0AAV4VN31_CAEEX|nr:hypothetical protein CEXT_138361 [Caerostris extrusa]